MLGLKVQGLESTACCCLWGRSAASAGLRTEVIEGTKLHKGVHACALQNLHTISRILEVLIQAPGNSAILFNAHLCTGAHELRQGRGCGAQATRGVVSPACMMVLASRIPSSYHSTVEEPCLPLFKPGLLSGLMTLRGLVGPVAPARPCTKLFSAGVAAIWQASESRKKLEAKGV